MGIKNPSVSDEFLVNEAMLIISQAQKRGIILRLLGAMAVWCHCSEYLNMYKNLKRLGSNDKTFTDIDFIGYSDQRKHIKNFLEEFGFIPDKYILALFSSHRYLYYHPKEYYHIDVFFDKLEFSHDVLFGSKPGKGRLELDYPTITLADLLLEKLQIHKIHAKDIKDLIVLIRAHELGDIVKKEVIDTKHIAKVLSDDWGFWYDATNNLKKVKFFTEKYYSEGLLSKTDLTDVVTKINILLDIIEKEPKTKRWEKRAKIGTSKPWFREVYDFDMLEC